MSVAMPMLPLYPQPVHSDDDRLFTAREMRAYAMAYGEAVYQMHCGDGCFIPRIPAVEDVPHP